MEDAKISPVPCATELAAYVSPDDLSGDLALIASLLGMNVAVALAINLAGVSLYISGRGLNAARIRWAQELLAKGLPPKAVALKLGVSERWLKTSCAEPACDYKETKKTL